jgi:hypothetical protein
LQKEKKLNFYFQPSTEQKSYISKYYYLLFAATAPVRRFGGRPLLRFASSACAACAVCAACAACVSADFAFTLRE